MGQEAHPAGCGRSAGFGDDDGRVPEWEDGLPSGGDLAPLFQTLITPELASAFGIMPEPPRTILDVQRASSDTIASIRRQVISSSSSNSDLTLRMIPSFAAAAPEDPGIVEGEGSASEDGGGCCSSEAVRCLDSVEEADSPVDLENPNSDDATRAQKRPRLVWTSQLHRRFVDVVDYLGVRNAVPKTIMHLMNVDGLTRENVASHLQKYRLYLKRNEASDLYETPVAMPMPGAAAPSALPMPVLGMAQNGAGAHVTVVPVNGQHCAVVYHGFGLIIHMLRSKNGGWILLVVASLVRWRLINKRFPGTDNKRIEKVC